MNQPVSVKVEWSYQKKSIGLPQSSTYVTVAKFREDADSWQKEAWSIALEFASPEVSHHESFEATASFLAPNAPWERLEKGNTFDLYEGGIKTAKVTVL